MPYFKSVVFAGGGCRSVWQAGFWHAAANALALDRAVIGCVSAGAAMACLVKAKQTLKGVDVFKQNFANNPKNAYLSNLGTSQSVFPQHRMYRKGLIAVLDEAAMNKIRQSPGIRVLIATPPAALTPMLSTILGIGVYTLEKQLLKPMHPTWSQKVGFKPLVVPAEKCDSVEQLTDLVLQSSCTPPFVPVLYRKGQPVLDGGLIYNVPVGTVEDVKGPMLVLLSRCYPTNRIPSTKGRVYVQPSRTPFISRWDYTNPDGLQKTFDLGCRDGEAFLKRFSVQVFAD